jgi:RND superfamily putative drug exporter
MASRLDSTLVRCLLVPAVMVLLGKHAWWLPRWMDRVIPHISIEGEEFFAQRDAATTADGPNDDDIRRHSARRPD